MTEQEVTDRIHAAHTAVAKGTGNVPRSCISASRLLVELLKGRSAEVPVHLLVLTAVGAQASQHINDFDELLAWLEEHPEHGAGIGIGEAGPEDWSGHLAVAIYGVRAGQTLFVDLTAAQTLPHLFPGPIPVKMVIDDAAFEHGEFDARVGGLRLVYRIVDNDGYKKAPNWRVSGQTRKTVADIKKFLKEQAKGRRNA